jgi:hypothetical protein
MVGILCELANCSLKTRKNFLPFLNLLIKRMALKEITEEEIVLVNLIFFIPTPSVRSVVNLIDITQKIPGRFNEEENGNV